MLRKNGYQGSKPLSLKKKKTNSLLGMTIGSSKNTIILDSPAEAMAFFIVNP